VQAEVLAAGHLRQGKAPSTLGMVTGTALVEVLRPRRSKALPRSFVLVVTADRVVAFKAVAGGGGPDSGPYTIRISPGEAGSWPRSSVRLVDLIDGAQSKDAILELDGPERFPVSRPNLCGDPDTDELFELLSGGVKSTRNLSEQELRRRADEQELRRALAMRSGPEPELARDEEQGSPTADLTNWAAQRGRTPRGAAPQAGHLSVTCPWSKDVLFNVIRGRWPGGVYGIVCHEVRLLEPHAPGTFRGAPLSTARGV
jgi:hypothetical protein